MHIINPIQNKITNTQEKYRRNIVDMVASKLNKKVYKGLIVIITMLVLLNIGFTYKVYCDTEDRVGEIGGVVIELSRSDGLTQEIDPNSPDTTTQAPQEVPKQPKVMEINLREYGVEVGGVLWVPLDTDGYIEIPLGEYSNTIKYDSDMKGFEVGGIIFNIVDGVELDDGIGVLRGADGEYITILSLKLNDSKSLTGISIREEKEQSDKDKQYLEYIYNNITTTKEPEQAYSLEGVLLDPETIDRVVIDHTSLAIYERDKSPIYITKYDKSIENLKLEQEYELYNQIKLIYNKGIEDRDTGYKPYIYKTEDNAIYKFMIKQD